MNTKLSIITLICFALGIIAGFIIPNFCQSIEFIGTIYINLLKIMIIPILFCSIASTMMKTSGRFASKITLKGIGTFIVMFVFSFLISSGIVSLLSPGTGFHFSEVKWDESLAHPSLADFFLSIFPDNIFAAMSTNSLLPVIIFAFVFGIACERMEMRSDKSIKIGVIAPINDKKYILTDVFVALTNAFYKMLQYIMYVTPLGVFALMGSTIANYGGAIIGASAKYILIAWLCCAVIALLVMMVPVWIYARINPIQYIKKIYSIWIMTLSTCSSAATLPRTIEVCNKNFGISEKITNLVVPLGCTIHMCGGAVSFSLLALFNMQMFNITMTPALFLIMIFTALLINMGAPGIPGGGIIIGATYLSILGIPLNFIGVYAGIYRLLDMAYTTMNVCGDITANILISHSLNKR